MTMAVGLYSLGGLYFLNPPLAIHYLGLVESGRFPAVVGMPAAVWLLDRGDTVRAA